MEAFPDVVIDYQKDIELLDANRWTTPMSKEQFKEVTGLDTYPDYLQKDVVGDTLKVYSNGDITYKLKGLYAKVSVIWNYTFPAGGGDTHFSVMKGSKADLIIRQGKEQGYKPELYIEALPGVDLVAYEKELAAFFDEDSDTKDDDFDVDAELEKPCITKPGDLWLLGNHRLVCGDSTKPETYELLMDGKQANLVVTDPPYNVNYEGSAGKIKNDNLENEKFYQFLLDAFTCMEKAMANDASIYVFHADTEGLNFRKAFADAGFYLSGTCIWKKQSLVLGRSPYQWQHEPCLFGWKKNGKHQWYSDRKQTTIWEFDKPKKNGDHPTMKPIPLIAYPIKNSSMSNCIVLDPFGGSGSTLIACEQTNRICHTIELDEKFCDVIVKRYIEQVGSAENVSVIRDGKTIAYSELEVTNEE